MNVNDYFKYKKRVVVKIGSSSLQHPQTGSMNRSGASGHRTTEPPGRYFYKTGVCSCWTGPANDDISADVCGVQSDSRTDSYDKGYNVRGRILSECAKYV